MTESVESQEIKKLIDSTRSLTESMDGLTHAIDELVKSNAMLIKYFVEAMAEDEDVPPSTFLNGRPINIDA